MFPNLKMFKINKLYFLIFLAFVFSCSINNRIRNKNQLLKSEILRWQNYRIDGIAEINYKSFRFRKDIQILKNEKSLRITLFDSGIFGLSPSPFFNLYADSTIVTTTFMGKKSDYSRLNKNINLSSFLTIDLSRKNIEDIINIGKLHRGQSTIFFNQEMRITKIKLGCYNVEVDFNYSSEKLISIKFKKDNKNIGNIRIDRITSKKNINIENTVS